MLIKTKLREANYMVLPGMRGEGIFPKQKQKRQEIIVDEACRYYGVTMKELNVKSRKQNLVTARQVIMYLLTKHSSLTLLAIGKMFNRDHTTAMYARDHIRDLLENDASTITDISEIESLI